MYWDNYNIALFNKCASDSRKFRCCICGEEVALDDSISKRGRKLTCSGCVTKISHLLDVSEHSVRDAIWR